MSDASVWMNKTYGTQRYFTYSDMIKAFETGKIGGFLMKTKHADDNKKFYCYLNEGEPDISEEKPFNFDNFKEAKSPKIYPVRNKGIAKLLYDTHLASNR